MVNRISARRYARAVFEIALEENNLELWRADLEKLARIGDNAGLLAVCSSPKISFTQKKEILSEFLEETNPLAKNLIYLLITRDRLSLIKEIYREYQTLLNSHLGIKRAVVTTAIPFDDKEKLENSLSKLIGKKVVVETHTDPSIIGGLIARINGKLLDGSLRSKLLTLKKEMVGEKR